MKEIFSTSNNNMKSDGVDEKIIKGDTESFEKYIPSDEVVEALENIKKFNHKTIDFYILSQILHEIKGNNPDMDSKEMMFLAERLHEACSASEVAIDRGERIWTLADILSEGITDRNIYNRYINLPATSPEKIKEVLLNCEMDDFIDLIDYIAIQNVKYFLDDPTVDYFYKTDVVDRLNNVVKSKYNIHSIDNVINDIKYIANDNIKYWSNAAGDLHHYGEYNITEDDLPEELKRAYNELYSERYSSFCYLVETQKGYGIALVNEYDDITAENYNMTMKDLFEITLKDAKLVSNTPEFSNADVYIGEGTGFDECHEIIVVFPASVSEEEFSKAAECLSNTLYQSIIISDRKSSLDEKISVAENTREPKDNTNILKDTKFEK